MTDDPARTDGREMTDGPEMTESASESRPSPEMLGGVVILLGAIPAFAIAMALKKGIDATTPHVGGIARLATAMMSAWGKWPAFLASAGVAFIGAAIFVGVIERDRVRAIIGTLVASLGLSALMSALTLGAGGSLGDATGGRLATGLGAWAGVALGVAVVLGAVWLGWLQGRVALPTGGAARPGWPSFRLPAFPRRAEQVRAKPRARQAVEPARLADVLTRADADVDGVSAAEASALAPDEKTLRYMEEVWRRAADGHAQVAPMPPSPYPVDVRLRGEIPPGAKPLGAPPGPARGPGAPQPVPGPGPGARSKGGAHPNEDGAPFSWRPEPRPRPATPAAYGEGIDPFLDADDSVDEEDARALADAIRREGAIVAKPSPYPPGVRPLGSPRSAPEAPAVRQRPSGAEAVEAFLPSALPPRPTWEQDELADLDDGVGAFASEPLLASDELPAWSRAVATVDVDDGAVVEDGDDVEVDELEEDDELEAEEEAEEEAEDEVEVAAAVDEEDEVEDVEDEEEDEEVDEDEDEEDAEDADVEAEDADGVDAVGAVVEAGGGEDDDGWIEEDEEEEDEDDDEEDEGDEGDEDEVEVADAARPSARPAAEPTPVTAAAAAVDAATFADDGLEYVEVDEPAPTVAAPVRRAPALPRRRGARPQPTAELDFGPPPERQVTLQPTAPKTPRAQTLHRAGALFVHEGRVAVSLLQRQLGLDFDDACTVLDELQEAGLIGPYKGGQKRDILLTAEEWAARCAAP